MEVTERGTITPPRSRVKQLAPLVALGAVIAAFFALGLQDYVSVEALRQHHETLTTYVSANPVKAVLIFIGIHAVGLATMLVPGSVSMVTGGFLFGQLAGTLWLAIGTTIGSTALFLLARTALRSWLERRAGPGIQKLRAGFERNAFTYMLFLRVVGMTPFAFQNLAPAFFGVRVAPYAVAAFLGCLPWTFVFATIGSGLSAVLATGDALDLSVVLTPRIMLPIFALGALVLTPLAYRHLQSRRTGEPASG